jgi:lambda repressor-like predicted transcriptional regulator
MKEANMETNLAKIIANDGDLTYRLLSKITGISKSTLNEIAQGQKTMTPKQRKLIADALGVKESDL